MDSVHKTALFSGPIHCTLCQSTLSSSFMAYAVAKEPQTFVDSYADGVKQGCEGELGPHTECPITVPQDNKMLSLT